MSTSRKIRSKRRRVHRDQLERIAIRQVELMLKAERRLSGKLPLSKQTLRRKAEQFHDEHFGSQNPAD